MKKECPIVIISFVTAGFILLYWLTVFTGIFEITDLVPGYKNWFMPFSAADLWIAVCALLAAIFILKGDKKGYIFGIMAGSSLVFLGIYAFGYGIITGLLFNLTVDEIIEILIKAYCLSVGPFLIYQSAKQLLGPKQV